MTLIFNIKFNNDIQKSNYIEININDEDGDSIILEIHQTSKKI